MKKVLVHLAFIGVALLLVAAFWYTCNWDRRPAFIQRSLAVFKENFNGTGPGFTFGQGSVKGCDDARILGWGYGWGLNGKAKAEFRWFCWTEPDGRVYFKLSADIKLTEQDIRALTSSEWNNQVNEEWGTIVITTPGYWRNNCSHETGKLVCNNKEVLDEPLARIKDNISSISEMRVEEYLFSP